MKKLSIVLNCGQVLATNLESEDQYKKIKEVMEGSSKYITINNLWIHIQEVAALWINDIKEESPSE
ncbi:hypothetical protein [Anaplasma marginale]|uniref:hypothetical protein n=1 Tax=Anaplasma marginale TaxID=770 RepID=UPI0005B4C6B2|nr:hypothetical protein [Anaplasma marginale]